MQTSELIQRVELSVRLNKIVNQAACVPGGLDLMEECARLAETLAKNSEMLLRSQKHFSKANERERVRLRIDDRLDWLVFNEMTPEYVETLVVDLVILRMLERKAKIEKALPLERLWTEEERTPEPSSEEVAQYMRETPEPTVTEIAEALAARGRQLELTKEQLTTPPQQFCQECTAPVEGASAVCDVCYERRFGRTKIDLSHVQG